MKKRLIGLVVGSCIIALGAMSLTLRYCHRSFMHIEEKELVTHACDDAVDKPISPNLARALLGTLSETLGDREDKWLTCVVDEKRPCTPPQSLKIEHGIFSALPLRYWVDVELDHGIVTSCKVSPAPGW